MSWMKDAFEGLQKKREELAAKAAEKKFKPIHAVYGMVALIIILVIVNHLIN